MTTRTIHVESPSEAALALDDAAAILEADARRYAEPEADPTYAAARARLRDRCANRAAILRGIAVDVRAIGAPDRDPDETYWQCHLGHMTTPPVRVDGIEWRYCPRCHHEHGTGVIMASGAVELTPSPVIMRALAGR